MTNPNEPIHPIVEENFSYGQSVLEARYEGLTVREYFSVLAMQGICAEGGNDFNDKYIEHIADISVKQADALIKRLNANNTGDKVNIEAFNEA